MEDEGSSDLVIPPTNSPEEGMSSANEADSEINNNGIQPILFQQF